MKTEEEINCLWDRLEEQKKSDKPDPDEVLAVRNELASEFYSIVEDVASRMALKLKEITAEECASYGVDGLYEAIDKFDRERGVKFRTFAPHRIKGAILDNIRKADWVPRLVRHRNNLIEKHRSAYYKEHGEHPTDKQLAKLIGMPVAELRKIAKKSRPVNVVSLNATPASYNDSDGEGDDLTHVTGEIHDPMDGMLRREMFQKFMGKNFTKLERKIIYLHYYEGLTMKEIADETNFSESRISQMHGEVMRRLREKVERNAQYAANLEAMFQAAS